jgi:hypothetical protein
MVRDSRSRRNCPAVELLEGRALLSAFGTRHHEAKITTNPAGVAALLSAIDGGAGHEFVTLIRKEIPNLTSVIGQFVSGAITEKSIPGFVAQVSQANPLYTGPGLDRMFLTEAGAIVLKKGVIELGAITRGPFYANSATTTITFAINRGAGSSLGPAFASEPGVTPDALVTITVGPYGQTYSGTITDLTTGATQSISPSEIEVEGPTVRVLVSPSQLPSQGLAPKNYRFSAWTSVVQFDGVSYPQGISSVGSFAPSNGTMVKIGVLATVKAPVL